MKKYFIYEFKRCLFPIGCLALIITAFYVTPIVTNNLFYSSYTTRVWIISSLGGATAACIPFWIFSYKMKRRSVDLFYALPLSHRKILTVKFLIGLIAVFAPYTIAYWLGAFAAMARFIGEMNAVWYLPQYFASLLPVYFIYAMSSFLFTRANKPLDGIIFVMFWACAFLLVACVLNAMTSVRAIMWYEDYYGVRYGEKNFIYHYYYAPWAPLDFTTAHFQEHIAGYLNIHPNKLKTAEIVNIVLGFTTTTLLAAGSTVGLFLFEGRAKAENAGQISESWFGYKVMLPLYVAFLVAICKPIYELDVFIAVGAFTLSAIYKRTPKIGITQTGILLGAAVAGIILCIFI